MHALLFRTYLSQLTSEICSNNDAYTSSGKVDKRTKVNLHHTYICYNKAIIESFYIIVKKMLSRINPCNKLH